MAELALFSPPKVGAPRAQAPRPSARSRAARRSSQRFPQSWGRIVRPEPKGVCRPGASATPRSRHPANPPESLDFRPPTSKIPYLWGPPVFRLSDGSQNFRVPASASVAHGQKGPKWAQNPASPLPFVPSGCVPAENKCFLWKDRTSKRQSTLFPPGESLTNR